MWDKDVNTYDCTVKFFPDCYKTQQMRDKAVNRCFLAFTYIRDWYKTE